MSFPVGLRDYNCSASRDVQVCCLEKAKQGGLPVTLWTIFVCSPVL
jgi:hypothetical protein